MWLLRVCAHALARAFAGVLCLHMYD